MALTCAARQKSAIWMKFILLFEDKPGPSRTASLSTRRKIGLNRTINRRPRGTWRLPTRALPVAIRLRYHHYPNVRLKSGATAALQTHREPDASRAHRRSTVAADRDRGRCRRDPW